MKARYLTMAAILAAVLTIDVSAQDGVTTTKMLVDPPRWPSNGIAERELGDGQETWPGNMFVEYSKGRLIAWVIASPSHGQAKAIDFFSGEVQDVKVKNPGGYNDSFVDAKDATHRRNTSIDLDSMDSHSGGIDTIRFDDGPLKFDQRIPYKPMLEVVQKLSPDETVIWRKVPLYCDSYSSDGSCRIWSSYIDTAMNLQDGTMLIAAGKYVIRVRKEDLMLSTPR
ncbi:hypothetical protein QFZ41_003689 [Luteibacter sp. W1I16]